MSSGRGAVYGIPNVGNGNVGPGRGHDNFRPGQFYGFPNNPYGNRYYSGYRG